jgi:hypothetical protein
MHIHGRHLGRLIATVAVVIGLAACGGRATGAGAAETPATTPAALASAIPGATQPLASDAGASPTPTPAATTPAPTPAPTLNLPDLSGVSTDISAIDSALADDAGAAAAEGSDK